MNNIKPLCQSSAALIQTVIDNKTKPVGSLGQLECLAKQLMLIQNQRSKESNFSDIDTISLSQSTMLVFAGDHGINEENVSIAPSDVTRQMVLNFLQGGAAINCFCQVNDIRLKVIDCGIRNEITLNEGVKPNSNVELVSQRLGSGTKNFSVKAAMSTRQVEQGLALGREITKKVILQGSEVILLGEMGIANTSSAAALMVMLTKYDPQTCVGIGTGITPEQLSNKITLITQATQRAILNQQNKISDHDILHCLSEVGGFEIVQLVGAILESARLSTVVVIDGFIVSVAALVAAKFDENVLDYLIFSHVSEEKAHQLLLKELQGDRKPLALLNLGLRLGEGTGAALSLNLIKAAASFYNNMASFDSAGVHV